MSNAQVPSVGIVIVNYRTAKICLDAVLSLAQEVRAALDVRILVLDGGSGDDSATTLELGLAQNSMHDIVRFVALPENKGFASANNVGIHRLFSLEKFQYIWLVNPDVVAYPRAMQHLVEFMNANQEYGIVGSRLEDPDGTSQLAARRFPNVFNELDSTARFGPISRLLKGWCVVYPEMDSCHECDWLPGASLLIRRDVFDKIGLLDDGFFMYYEEVDFCHRAKQAGFKVGYVPQSRLVHLVGQSSGVTSTGKRAIKRRRPAYWYDSRCRYFSRHYGTAGLLAANLAFIVGTVIHKAISFTLRRENTDPPYLLRDFCRYSFSLRSKSLPSASVQLPPTEN